MPVTALCEQVTDAVRLRPRVTHKGKVWDNTPGTGNAWEPGVYGWTSRG